MIEYWVTIPRESFTVTSGITPSTSSSSSSSSRNWVPCTSNGVRILQISVRSETGPGRSAGRSATATASMLRVVQKVSHQCQNARVKYIMAIGWRSVCFGSSYCACVETATFFPLKILTTRYRIQQKAAGLPNSKTENRHDNLWAPGHTAPAVQKCLVG